MTNPTQSSQQVPVAFEDEKINVLIAQHFPEPYYAIRAQNFARALLAQSAPAAIDRDAVLEEAAIIGGREAEKCLNMPDGQRVADAIRLLKSPPQTGKEVES